MRTVAFIVILSRGPRPTEDLIFFSFCHQYNAKGYQEVRLYRKVLFRFAVLCLTFVYSIRCPLFQLGSCAKLILLSSKGYSCFVLHFQHSLASGMIRFDTICWSHSKTKVQDQTNWNRRQCFKTGPENALTHNQI